MLKQCAAWMQCISYQNAHGSGSKGEDAKYLNQAITQLKDKTIAGLKYQTLDSKSAKLMVFSDTSFGSNNDSTSQLGYIITMTDEHGISNVLHYSSTKSRRVTRSVLAAELFVMKTAFYAAGMFKVTLEEMYNRKLDMVMCTDSKSLFD